MPRRPVEHLGHRGVDHHPASRAQAGRPPSGSVAVTQDTGPPEVNTTAVCLRGEPVQRPLQRGVDPVAGTPGSSRGSRRRARRRPSAR